MIVTVVGSSIALVGTIIAALIAAGGSSSTPVGNSAQSPLAPGASPIDSLRVNNFHFVPRKGHIEFDVDGSAPTDQHLLVFAVVEPEKSNSASTTRQVFSSPAVSPAADGYWATEVVTPASITAGFSVYALVAAGRAKPNVPLATPQSASPPGASPGSLEAELTRESIERHGADAPEVVGQSPHLTGP